MRRVWMSTGLLVLICVGPVGQRQAQAQSELVGLGVRLAALQTLNVVFTVGSTPSRDQTAADQLKHASQTLEFLRLVKSESLDEILAMYSPTASVILPDGAAVNARDLRSWFTEAFDRLTVSRNTLRLDPSGIHRFGDHAVVTGFIVTEFADRKGLVSHLSVSSDFKVLLVKEDGDWRVLRQSFTQPNGSWGSAN